MRRGIRLWSGRGMKRPVVEFGGLGAVALSVAALWSVAGVRAEPAALPTKPQYGTWGFDAAGGDTATKPGDDFFRYVSGGWVDRTEIPADKPIYSLRLMMTDLTEQRLHDILEQTAANAGHAPTTVEGKVGAFYKGVHG